MATPFVRRKSIKELGIGHLSEIFSLLVKHGFPFVDYDDLGLQLGLSRSTLDIITHQNSGNVDSCVIECLKAWLQGDPEPTFDVLIQALREMEENTVADGIEKEILYIDTLYTPVQSYLYFAQVVYETQRPGREWLMRVIFGKDLDLLAMHINKFKKVDEESIEISFQFKDNDDGFIELCFNDEHCPKGWSVRPHQPPLKVSRSAIDKYGSMSPPRFPQCLITITATSGEDAAQELIYPVTMRGVKSDTEKIFITLTKGTIKQSHKSSAKLSIPKGKIEKWLEEGEVELKVTRINMHGPPRAGKTCSQRLLLNEPPPPFYQLTGSTPVVCPAVQATRISIDDKNKKWKRVEIDDLLSQLASTEVDEVPMPQKDIFACLDVPSLEKTPAKNKQTINKLTEKKPTNIKLTKKPMVVEVFKKILGASEAGKSRKLSTNWVYFIDSGGQPAYRELLPLFTRAAALNIITIDLTKPLDEKCEFQYCIGQHTSAIKTNLKYSNLDIIQSTISSEAMFSPIKFPYVSQNPDHPHYLILGTRKELVTEENLKAMNEMLIEYKANKKVIKHNERQDSIIFPVNTMLPGGSKEREEASMKICTEISNARVAMTIKLPIRLFPFEISLQIEAKKMNRSFLTKEEVIEIGKQLRLDKESDINDALQYLHNVTIILYYHDVLPNLIFVDPKPILDVLSHLIAITYVNHTDLHLIADPPPSSKERDCLIKLGLFKEELLAIIGKEIFNNDFRPSDMIRLLNYLHIIAKAENREEGDYFFPCALQSYDKLKDPPTEIQPLIIAWEIDNSGTTNLAIPQGLFPLTIVHLLKQKGDIGFTPVSKEYYRCHDAMSLHVYIEGEKYTIDIINLYTHIEIHLDDCKRFCPQIRRFVTKAITKSRIELRVGKNFIFAFKCHINEQCYCIVQEDKFSTRCTYCRSRFNILQKDDSYRCWFSDFQFSSLG
ncbi:PREDICTED: uncharacterized protein LOC109585588 [Amphimedon queenslandica]|uniref:Death domain-containing protein n=1 Tax=Amphimedon queenslandica TaxID=400682 RepID=A0AAN0JKN8_AMPQE|nr:PREDICTED: uncharacterized protein LOC109585588 [Amphimedon queenslandica]|eukprot:XP_019857273.1 PREDICTED: uncharacterized protein LOC109585588 [Amphimedon queenslandica]